MGLKLLAVALGLVALICSHVVERAEAHKTLLVFNSFSDSSNPDGNITAWNISTGAYKSLFIPTVKNGQRLLTDTIVEKGGHLYLTGYTDSTGQVLKYTKTGKFVGRFDKGKNDALARPYGLIFSADKKHLYVSNFGRDQIVSYNGLTGAFEGIKLKGNGSGTIQGPNGFAYDSKKRLYATTEGSVGYGNGTFDFLYPSQIVRLSPETGRQELFIDQPAAPADGQGYVSLLGLLILPKGKLFPFETMIVSDYANDLRYYNLETKALVKLVRTAYLPSGGNNLGNLVLCGKKLYVTGFDATSNVGVVLRFDAKTGAPLPAPGKPGAVFIGPNPRLKRPIGLYVL